MQDDIQEVLTQYGESLGPLIQATQDKRESLSGNSSLSHSTTTANSTPLLPLENYVSIILDLVLIQDNDEVSENTYLHNWVTEARQVCVLFNRLRGGRY